MFGEGLDQKTRIKTQLSKLKLNLKIVYLRVSVPHTICMIKHVIKIKCY